MHAPTTDPPPTAPAPFVPIPNRFDAAVARLPFSLSFGRSYTERSQVKAALLRHGMVLAPVPGIPESREVFFPRESLAIGSNADAVSVRLGYARLSSSQSLTVTHIRSDGRTGEKTYALRPEPETGLPIPFLDMAHAVDGPSDQQLSRSAYAVPTVERYTGSSYPVRISTLTRADALGYVFAVTATDSLLVHHPLHRNTNGGFVTLESVPCPGVPAESVWFVALVEALERLIRMGSHLPVRRV